MNTEGYIIIDQNGVLWINIGSECHGTWPTAEAAADWLRMIPEHKQPKQYTIVRLTPVERITR